jgi:RNA-directed DNA polymerase
MKAFQCFNQITEYVNLEKSFFQAINKNYRYKRKALEFGADLTYNINNLREELINGTYQFGKYSSFYIYEPKKRFIQCPDFRDKIIQCAICKVLSPFYEKSFITDTYACINNRGTHRASDKMQLFLKQAHTEYGQSAQIIKFDISEFFFSIDREILKNILAKKIKCHKTLALIHKIIDSSPGEKGLPLGNMTSQLFANIYLNELDQYCKRNLSIKYYVRYMDDCVIICKDKKTAREILEKMKFYAKKHLNLQENDKKTKIFPIKQGVNSIGYKTYITHKLLRNSCKKKIKRKISKIPKLIKENKLSVERAELMLNSWRGHAIRANSYNFIQSLAKKYAFLDMDKNLKFTIDLDDLDKSH